MSGSDLTKTVGRGSLGRSGHQRQVSLDRRSCEPGPHPHPRSPRARAAAGTGLRSGPGPPRARARIPTSPPAGPGGHRTHQLGRQLGSWGRGPSAPKWLLRSPRRRRAAGRGRKCLQHGPRRSRRRGRRQGGGSRTSGRPRREPGPSASRPPAPLLLARCSRPPKLTAGRRAQLGPRTPRYIPQRRRRPAAQRP